MIKAQNDSVKYSQQLDTSSNTIKWSFTSTIAIHVTSFK